MPSPHWQKARSFFRSTHTSSDGKLSSFIKDRYSSYDTGIGAKIESGAVGFEDLEKYMLEKGDAAKNTSGRQEMLENLVNTYLCQQ